MRRRRVPWDWTDILIFVGVMLLLPAGTDDQGRLLTLAGQAIRFGGYVTHLVDTGLQPSSRNALESFTGQTFFYAVALAVVLLLVIGRRHATVRDLGWRSVATRWLLLAAPLTVVALIVAAVLGAISAALFPGVSNAQCTAVRAEYGHVILIAIPAVSVVAPLVEETIFRGFIFGWLSRQLPWPAAAVLSALIFAGAHFIKLLLLPLFGVGLLLAYLYHRTGSLWPGVVVHGLFNLVGIVQILNATSC